MRRRLVTVGLAAFVGAAALVTGGAAVADGGPGEVVMQLVEEEPAPSAGQDGETGTQDRRGDRDCPDRKRGEARTPTESPGGGTTGGEAPQSGDPGLL